ncbi:hypothetical protein FRB99_004996 [Tulasnella sp. 403]|nr:hypothetical protein FRB99_004996 [Tulasnella sp. 403]
MAPPHLRSIVLPASYMNGDEADVVRYLGDLMEFISSPLPHSIITSHLNSIAGKDESAIPPLWNDWWNTDWLDKVELQPLFPESIQRLVQSIHELSLPREVTETGSVEPFRLADDQRFGMTPKKQHEVEEMCGLVKHLAAHAQAKRIVDVGAGQGYLTRNLAAAPLSFDVLALDSSDAQVEGANKRLAELERWQNKVLGKKRKERSTTAPDEPAQPNGRITRSTVFVDTESLPKVVDEWVEGEGATSVLIVGLHACGPLTPAVLRSFVAMNGREGRWKCGGLALVGCCYNRIRDIRKNIPLSQTVKNHPVSLKIESLHLHLAAQVTHNWLEDWAGFELGLRKIVFRGMLERVFGEEHKGEMYKQGLQVGRFNDEAYETWETYLERASRRLNIPLQRLQGLAKRTSTSTSTTSTPSTDHVFIRCLQFLHIIRCMMGPVIESLLLVDRWMMLRESEIDARMVNLFDQSTGSARNIALVVGF